VSTNHAYSLLDGIPESDAGLQHTSPWRGLYVCLYFGESHVPLCWSYSTKWDVIWQKRFVAPTTTY